MMRLPFLAFLVVACLAGCAETSNSTFPAPKEVSYSDMNLVWPEDLTEERYRDKVLGMLVGSAIGDAMGAPTEMWDRDQIRQQYGFVNGFTQLNRPRSAEGPWGAQMQAGATTDDTRWKYLITRFFVDQKGQLDPISGADFASFITTSFRQEAQELSDAKMNPSAISRELTHLAWLQEWAMVAGPYAKGDFDQYHIALNKFYGGEMSCAGMLYAPSVGLLYPGNPTKAYYNSHRLSIFDIGYAKDISSLTAAYVATAMDPSSTWKDVVETTTKTDPHNYGESRLIGRIAEQSALLAASLVTDAKSIVDVPGTYRDSIPAEYKGTPLRYKQLQTAYAAMDLHLKEIPFHAGEIYLINMAALYWSEGDFSEALEFVTNYGRDNDTVGAITGAILGALLGRERLPAEPAAKAEEINRDILGIDLVDLADQMVASLPRPK